MSGHRNVGGTPGWKARRTRCPRCGRDVATGPEYRRMSDPLAGRFRLVKRHHAAGTRGWCKGVGVRVLSENTYDPPR